MNSAEFIFEGANGNLVGGRTFVGDDNAQTPQNAVVIGTTGSGKSVTVIDILTQTEPYYGYTTIVEEGGSYLIYTKTVDPTAEPIVIQSNGRLTMNYLDTGGLPLSGLHLSAAAALPMLMVGQSRDEDRTKLRHALLSNTIGRLYDDFARWFLNRHPERRGPIARRAFVASFDEGEITRFTKDGSGIQQVCDLGFAEFTPKDYLQHGHLHRELHTLAYNALAAMCLETKRVRGSSVLLILSAMRHLQNTH